MSELTPPNRDWLLAELTAAVRRLALPATDQLAYLRELGSGQSADELALELDDVVSATLANERVLSEGARRRVRDLSDKLDEMSGASRAELWSADALQTSADWVEVRRRAAMALAELEAASSMSG